MQGRQGCTGSRAGHPCWARLAEQQARWAARGELVNLHQQKHLNEIHTKHRPPNGSVMSIFTLCYMHEEVLEGLAERRA